jgi:HD-like signal output (HDOD) protein
MEEEIHTSIDRSIYGFMITKQLENRLTPEMSLIAGLVSKIGHIVLLRYISDSAEYKTISVEDASQIIDDIGDNLGEDILHSWDFPADVIKAVFGIGKWNLNTPKTYRDAYLFTNAYLVYKKDGEATDAFLEIDKYIEDNQAEMISLESIFG